MSFLFSYSGVNFFVMLCIRLLIIFTILPIHEYAHGYAARKLGDNTALYSGRLTLNPLAHVDPIGAILLLICGFGWAKPVPINPRNFQKYRRDIALTAFAGPLSNLICAFAGTFVGRVLYNILNVAAAGGTMSQSAFSVLYYITIAVQAFTSINLSLAIFNLIPIEPLDGSRILSYFLTPKANAFMAKYRNYFYYGMLLLLFTGILSTPLSWIIDKVYTLFNLMFFWVDILFGMIF